MSYATFDHGGWVQQQIGYARSGRRPRADNTKGWWAAPDELSEFQLKVFDILGMVYGGIYNAPIAWEAVQWGNVGPEGLAVPVRHNELATFDGFGLTRLVMLCHEARIRCAVQAHGPRGLRLLFTGRGYLGAVGVRHPDLDEAVADFRAYLPADHRIHHCAAPPSDGGSLTEAS